MSTKATSRSRKTKKNNRSGGKEVKQEVQPPIEQKEQNVSKINKRAKKEPNVSIASNAYHRIARKAGIQLISTKTYYMYDEIVRVLFTQIIRKALALTINAKNKIIQQEDFCNAIYNETGRYPVAPVLSGKKAKLPNFKKKSVKSKDNKSVVTVGRIALQEIATFQKQSDILYVAKTPFENKIKKITASLTKEINALYGVPSDRTYMYQSGVYLIAQSFFEQLLLDITQSAQKLSKHCKRSTLYYTDIALVLQIARDQGGDLRLPVEDMIERIKMQHELSISRK